MELGPQAPVPANAQVRLIAFEGGMAGSASRRAGAADRVILNALGKLGPVDDQGVTYVGFWLASTGCRTVTLKATLVGAGPARGPTHRDAPLHLLRVATQRENVHAKYLRIRRRRWRQQLQRTSPLVQAILLKIRRAAGSSYLTSYDGSYGKTTKDAIQAFQTEQVFISDERGQSVPNPNATQALVRPGDATWQKLLSKVDAAFSDLRVLAGGKTVYVAATSQQLTSRVNEVGTFTFAPVFRQKVLTCIRQMHEQFGIACGVCPQGDRRTFQAQYLLLTGGAGGDPRRAR